MCGDEGKNMMEFFFWYMLSCVWELGAIANLSFSQSLNQGGEAVIDS